MFKRTAAAMDQVKQENGFRIVGSAYLGNGSGTVVADKLNRVVNLWQEAPGGDQRITFTAYLWVNTNIPFENIAANQVIEVDIGFPPNDNRLHALWQKSGPAITATGGYTQLEMKAHAAAHQPLADVPDWRATAQGSEVHIGEGKYIDASGDEQKWYGGSTNAAATTLATRQAALTSGQHQFVWITFNLTSGILVTEASSAVTAVGTLPSRNEFLDADYTVATTNRKLIPVYLYYGQTAIAEADIVRKWDMRWPVMEPGTGSGSGDVTGPGSATDNAIARFDGTTGKAIQNSATTIDDNGALTNAGPVMVDGDTDAVQLTVQAHTSQSANLQVWEDSSGVDLMTVANTGDVVPGTDVVRTLGIASKRFLYAYAKNVYSDALGTWVKNTSGNTANVNHVGYITYTAASGAEYKTTTTANLNASWCVVLVGGANNADIYVATSGVVTVELNANCSAGDFLTTSTTAGRAATNSTLMRPEIFAIALTANSGGAGGTCTARLYCNTQPIDLTDANFLLEILGSSSSLFVATINGAPSATSVTYNAPSSGNENCIVPGAAGDLLKARLHNTTRGTYRLITAVNTGTNVITTVSSTDAWASGDTITIESQTVTSGTTNKMIDYDFSQTTLPALIRMIFMRTTFMDTGAGTNNQGFIHPFTTYANANNFTLIGQGAGLYITSGTPPIPVINRVICASVLASGVGTSNFFVQTFAALVAAP